MEPAYDAVVRRLVAATRELIVGHPASPGTQVGPVIDEGAYQRLMDYRASQQAHWVKTLPVPEQGLYVPPTLIRLGAIEDLKKEWFGPLLHVATWRAGALVETVRRINAAGFGLTMGLHSRIARAAETPAFRTRWRSPPNPRLGERCWSARSWPTCPVPG